MSCQTVWPGVSPFVHLCFNHVLYNTLISSKIIVFLQDSVRIVPLSLKMDSQNSNYIFIIKEKIPIIYSLLKKEKKNLAIISWHFGYNLLPKTFKFVGYSIFRL